MFNKNKTITDLRQRLHEEEIRNHNLRGEVDNAETRANLLQNQLIILTNEYEKLVHTLSARPESTAPSQPSSPQPPVPNSPKLSKPLIDVNLNDYVILRPDSYPCDQCPLEHTQCKKLSFHDQTICITHKDAVPKIL